MKFSLNDLVDSLKKKLAEEETQKKNENIGRTGPIESRPTADIASRYERLKKRGWSESEEDEERNLESAIEETSSGGKIKGTVFSGNRADPQTRMTRAERFELLKELKKRNVK